MTETTRTRERTAGPSGAAGRRHVYEFQVRFADLDPFNHVNNVRFLTHLEDARIALLHWDRLAAGQERFGPLVVARHEVDYKRPLTLRPEPVRIETWVGELRRTSFTLRYEVRDDAALYLEARSVMVGYDPEGLRPRRLSAAEHAYLSGYLAG
ncbi:acyl-CoA thioester hydrolase [Allonocardiopsis opalescens]|uniref:Acyl-CoA thioester hydrolase n=1 Tax=Allonocardiopsis opalescens TaxID=1144618 RepID=A0A2T0PXG6_9ACTN|nr:thioesterase family protein [Allonocardiopsis opalescens]PRX96230.1 acyl-CoA thioester hydrolase [Allonocardiopsis opalescens]